MGSGDIHPLAPRGILATGFGALLVLYALTSAVVVVESTTESVGAGTLRLESGTVTLERTDASVVIGGTIRDEATAAALIELVLATDGITAAVDLTTIDPDAVAPALSAIRAFLNSASASTEATP